MHRIFGTKENAEYWDRKGAYLIPEREGKIGVAKTPRGFFLLGGGIEHGEDHLACIERECLEEVGYSAAVKGELCSAETYMTSSRFGYFHPIQSYYYGELLEKVTEPVEINHELYWTSYEELKGKLNGLYEPEIRQDITINTMGSVKVGGKALTLKIGKEAKKEEE